MTLAALAAAMVFPVGGTAYGGEVTDGALIYLGETRQGGVIQRLELDSGLRTTLYTTPGRRTSLSRMYAGGGRVVFELGSRLGTRILAMGARGAPVVEIVRGQDDGRGVCGSSARLRCMTAQRSRAALVAAATCSAGRVPTAGFERSCLALPGTCSSAIRRPTAGSRATSSRHGARARCGYATSRRVVSAALSRATG